MDEFKAALMSAGVSYSAPNLKLCFQFKSLAELDAAYSAMKPHGLDGETPVILARLAVAETEIARLKAIMLDEDLIWDAISDSLDMDWTPKCGARAVVRCFQKEIDGE